MINIQKINLSRTKITDEGLKVLAENNHNVQYICSWSTIVTEQGLEYLIKNNDYYHIKLLIKNGLQEYHNLIKDFETILVETKIPKDLLNIKLKLEGLNFLITCLLNFCLKLFLKK